MDSSCHCLQVIHDFNLHLLLRLAEHYTSSTGCEALLHACSYVWLHLSDALWKVLSLLGPGCTMNHNGQIWLQAVLWLPVPVTCLVANKQMAIILLLGQAD